MNVISLNSKCTSLLIDKQLGVGVGGLVKVVAFYIFYYVKLE